MQYGQLVHLIQNSVSISPGDDDTNGNTNVHKNSNAKKVHKTLLHFFGLSSNGDG